MLNTEQIKELVEEPLILACQILYDKNIQTVASNANCEGEQGEASIGIDWNSLSEQNRKIAESLGLTPIQNEFGQTISFTMPITKNTVLEQVEDYFSKLAQMFVLQEPSWIPRYSIDDLKTIYGYPENEEAEPSEFVESGYFYDDVLKTFYESEDHYRKINEWQKSENK